jgi:hypothetical protein
MLQKSSRRDSRPRLPSRAQFDRILPVGIIAEPSLRRTAEGGCPHVAFQPLN